MPKLPQISMPSFKRPEIVQQQIEKYNQFTSQYSGLFQVPNIARELFIVIILLMIQFDVIPPVWTLVTSNLLDTNLVYLCLNLYILQHFMKELDNIWTKKQLYSLLIYVSIFTGLFEISWFHIKQNFTLFVKSYQILPQVYLGLFMLVQFLFELDQDLRLISSFYVSWFFLRFFMKNKLNSTQVGDQTLNFSLHTFFPEYIQENLMKVCDKFQDISDKIWIISIIQNRLRSPLQNSDPNVRKKALENLDEEIKQLTGKKSEDNDEGTVQGQGQNTNTTITGQTSVSKRRKNSESQMQFNDQGDEDFSDIEIKIKEELRKE
ncbi:UNKNOWN [Stylonychia lemnae]|uniref:Transmembrane protein n=1 Tax=Stylonychia lemnae TaxID=5949 RepID=A0A078AIS6_STYLE|nr:UNKNOWN [Stylonychia lemnae]|eukprot:CDW80713.1 UNKNOWN [Stylonychia lemnae]